MPHYKGLQDEVLDLLGIAGPKALTMVKAAMNRQYRYMLNMANADEERREFSLTTVASTSKYGLPLYVKEILNIDDGTNDKNIFTTSARQYDLTYPGTSSSGTPDLAYIVGKYGAQAQPSSAEKLKVVSSSTSDGSNFEVRINGFVSGVLTTEVVTMDGTTEVATSNTFDANGIERTVKDQAEGFSWTGNVTIKGNTSGTTFSVIPQWWESPTYLWIEFHPIPSSVLTYTVRALMRKPDLVNDEDWAEIDAEFHNVLVWGTALELLPTVGKLPQAQDLRVNFQTGMKRYAGVVNDADVSTVQTFADVTTVAIVPGRPLIQGIDYL